MKVIKPKYTADSFWGLKIVFVFFCLVYTNLYSSFAQQSQSGNLVDFVLSIKTELPGMDQNKFVIPNSSELAEFQSVFLELKGKNYSVIQNKINPYNYEFIEYYDLPTGGVFYILKEKNPISLGWGTYIFNPLVSDSVSIEVPHPLWDTNTWMLGIKSFLKLNSSWFLMAGTHRYCNTDASSDVAHGTKNIFHTVHQTVATPIAIQIHGFSKSNGYTDYPDVVISNGTYYPPSLLYLLKSSYEAKGFTSGVFSFSTSSSLEKLGATTNTQGKWSNSNAKSFIHIEHEYALRTSQSNIDKVVEVLAENLLTTTSIEEDNNTFDEKILSIKQNYPNPFNGTTTTLFSVDQPLILKIEVFNVLGELIMNLGENYYNVGNHTMQINFNQNSGIYLLKISGKGFCETQKLALVK